MAANHQRNSSHPKKLPAHARPSKPAPLTKRHSYQSAYKTAHKPVLAIAKHDDEEELMAASFLNYCTFCEKQIVVPSNSVLYCSEACRKKDNNKSLAAVSENSPPSTPFAAFSFDDLPVRDIVAPRSPTAAPLNRLSATYSSTSEDEPSNSEDEHRYAGVGDSEAARYLRQFHTSTSMTNMSAYRSARPNYHRSSTSVTGTTVSNAPSLSHTPSTLASASLPYTPATNRPLPPRINPAASSYGSKFGYNDLVTPFTGIPTTAPSSLSNYSLKSAASSQTTVGVAEGELMYEKKTSIPSVSPGQGSLKQLFAWNEMRS